MNEIKIGQIWKNGDKKYVIKDMIIDYNYKGIVFCNIAGLEYQWAENQFRGYFSLYEDVKYISKPIKKLRVIE